MTEANAPRPSGEANGACATTTARDDHPHPAWVALGIAVLAIDRLGAGEPARTVLATGVGLLAQTATEARTLARSRRLLGRVVAEARRRGEAVVDTSRTDASAFVQSTVADSIAWAQARVTPQLVDRVVPQLLDGALPETRAQVVPAVIDDLTDDPRARDLMPDQGHAPVA